MSVLRILIVDDEAHIRLGIRDLLAGVQGVDIVGECETAEQAIAAVEAGNLDLLLLDVHLPDSSGLEVVRRIGPEQMPMVIFVTAYDEYAVTAFEMNAVDYLLKPFDEDRLRKSIERASRALADRDRERLALRLEALLNATNNPPAARLVVRNGSRYDFVPVDSIDWIESANNFVELHCGIQIHILSETLSGIERKLDSRKFIRVHRCRIVNLTRIVAVHTGFGGAYELEMRNGVRLMTGRQFRGVLQTLLG